MPEHILSLSYGKDSMACFGACEILGWPIDRVVTAEVWATDTILTALRPVSREQVEKVFPGCPYCKPDSEGYVQKFGAYSILNGELKTGHCKPQKISFCPHCSRPLTDEAVEMVMEKINNMEEITNEH